MDQAVDKMKQINLIAPTGYTGYGQVGFNIVKTLKDDYKIYLQDYGNRRNYGYDGLSVDFHHDAPCLNVWHQNNLQNRIGRGKYVAFPIFELESFTEQELHHLKYPDDLIVCSKWAKDVLSSYSINSNVIPLGVDREIFNLDKIPNMQKKTANVVFMNVGKWEIRKGHDILVELFNAAFKPTDHVELWLMPHNQFISSDEHDMWCDYYINTDMGRANKIKIISPVETSRDMAKIMSMADIGIFPARAEGWNLEILEMMALGKHIITTDYAGHTEFCTSKNSSLVEIDELEYAYDGRWFFDQGSWAKIGTRQIQLFIDYMRECYNNCFKGCGHNTQGILTADEYNWSHLKQIPGILGLDK